MTPEQRLDRLERIAKLFVKAGQRARVQMREMNEKIYILIDAQIRNEERFAQTDEKIARLADSQADAARKLDALIDLIRREHEERRGNSEQS